MYKTKMLYSYIKISINYQLIEIFIFICYNIAKHNLFIIEFLAKKE